MTDAVSSHCSVPSAWISGSRTWLPCPSVSAGNCAVIAASMSRISSAVRSSWDAAGSPEAPATATMTSPVIPPSAWPGTEQMKPMPSAGTVSSPVAVSPPSAAIFVPSAKVTSWGTPPSFTKVTV